jgi:hypothetical protein
VCWCVCGPPPPPPPRPQWEGGFWDAILPSVCVCTSLAPDWTDFIHIRYLSILDPKLGTGLSSHQADRMEWYCIIDIAFCVSFWQKLRVVWWSTGLYINPLCRVTEKWHMHQLTVALQFHAGVVYSRITFIISQELHCTSRCSVCFVWWNTSRPFMYCIIATVMFGPADRMMNCFSNIASFRLKCGHQPCRTRSLNVSYPQMINHYPPN